MVDGAKEQYHSTRDKRVTLQSTKAIERRTYKPWRWLALQQQLHECGNERNDIDVYHNKGKARAKSGESDERSRAGERKRHSKPYLELGLHTVAATV